MNTPELSIVIPVFNSAGTLEDLCAGIDKAVQHLSYEVILVDDGSKDNSWEKIEALKAKYPDKIKGIRLSKNFGQHNAIICGFTFVRGNMVITMDDDLQHPPAEIPKLIEKMKSSQADVVYGKYTVKHHSRIRNVGGNIARSTSKTYVGNVGIGSSFRIMKRSIVDQVTEHKNQAHLFIDEILHWYTARFEQVEVEHHERKEGKSGYTFFRLVAIFFDTMVNYTAIPLKLMTWIGLFSSLVTFFMGIIFIYRKLVHDVRPGFTAEIVAILFSTSLLMFCMGIIGQYLYKIYHMQSRRPSYSIHTVI